MDNKRSIKFKNVADLKLLVTFALNVFKSKITMKTNKKTEVVAIFVAILLMVLWTPVKGYSNDAVTGLLMEQPQRDQRIRSSQIIETGAFVDVNGSLRQMGGEWFLAVDGVLHQLRLGPETFREQIGIQLESQVQTSVRGYFLIPEGEMTGILLVCAMSIGDQVYRFREDDGTRLWQW